MKPRQFSDPTLSGSINFGRGDARQNEIATLDSSGALRTNYRYTDFGAPSVYSVGAPTGLEPTFGGMRYLDIPGTPSGAPPIAGWPQGLYLGMYRLYDPYNGVWLSNDPLGYVDGPNRSAYVAQNPIGFIDPLGLRKDSASEQPDLDDAAGLGTIQKITPKLDWKPVNRFINDRFGIWAKTKISGGGPLDSTKIRWALEEVAERIEEGVRTGKFDAMRRDSPLLYEALTSNPWTRMDIKVVKTVGKGRLASTDRINLGDVKISMLDFQEDLDGVQQHRSRVDYFQYLGALLFHEVVHSSTGAGEQSAYVLTDFVFPRMQNPYLMLSDPRVVGSVKDEDKVTSNGLSERTTSKFVIRINNKFYWRNSESGRTGSEIHISFDR